MTYQAGAYGDSGLLDRTLTSTDQNGHVTSPPTTPSGT